MPSRTSSSSTLSKGPSFKKSVCRWIPDENATSCFSCEAPFNVFRRKHHCRECGKVFCDNCSRWRRLVPDVSQSKPMRVCGPCRDPPRPGSEPPLVLQSRLSLSGHPMAHGFGGSSPPRSNPNSRSGSVCYNTAAELPSFARLGSSFGAEHTASDNPSPLLNSTAGSHLRSPVGSPTARHPNGAQDQLDAYLLPSSNSASHNGRVQKLGDRDPNKPQKKNSSSERSFNGHITPNSSFA